MPTCLPKILIKKLTKKITLKNNCCGLVALRRIVLYHFDAMI